MLVFADNHMSQYFISNFHNTIKFSNSCNFSLECYKDIETFLQVLDFIGKASFTPAIGFFYFSAVFSNKLIKFSKGKIFYAFNLEQLKEGMESIGLNLKETKKVAYLGAGVYIRADEIQNYKKFKEKQRKEFEENMKIYDFAKSAFKSELANHEMYFCF